MAYTLNIPFTFYYYYRNAQYRSSKWKLKYKQSNGSKHTNNIFCVSYFIIIIMLYSREALFYIYLGDQ